MNFAIEIHPYKNETLTSWIIRNAIANGSEPKSFALAVFKKDSTWYQDIDRYLPDDKAIQLSSLCSLSLKEIKSLTLEPLIQKLSHKSLEDNPYSKWQLISPIGLKGAIRTNGFYFCPKCLNSENIYLKKQWRLAWNIACPIHKNLLILNCEKCGQIFSPHLVTYNHSHLYSCANCGFDLRKSTTEYVNKEALIFQEKLSKVAFSSFKKIPFLAIRKDKKDLFLTLTFFLSLFVHINKKDKYSLVFKQLNLNNKQHTFKTSNNTIFTRMNIKDKEYLFQLVSRLFKLHTDEIITLLKKTGMTQSVFKRTFKSLSPTIKYIFNHLDNKTVYKPSRKLSKNILPKSKEEVDKLFEDIKDYI